MWYSILQKKLTLLSSDKAAFTLELFRLVFSRKTKKLAEMRAESPQKIVFPTFFPAPKIDGKPKVESRKLNSHHSVPFLMRK